MLIHMYKYTDNRFFFSQKKIPAASDKTIGPSVYNVLFSRKYRPSGRPLPRTFPAEKARNFLEISEKRRTPASELACAREKCRKMSLVRSFSLPRAIINTPPRAADRELNRE